MNSNLKYKLILILIFSFSLSFGQDYIDKIIDFSKSEIHDDYQSEFSLEMIDVFKKISNTTDYDLNFQNCDSLFIIRGLDIQNRTSYGRIWNNKVRFDYIDTKIRGNGKIEPNAEVSIDNAKCYTKDFDSIITLIEIGDFKTILKISEKHSVLSGVSWSIIRLYYNQDDIKYDFHVIQDFAIVN